MIIEVNRTGVELSDADDFGRLAIVVDNGVDDLAEIVAPVGVIDDDEAHAWIDIECLRALHRPNVSVSWQRGFETMIRYAKDSGWVSPDGTSVRVHIASR